MSKAKLVFLLFVLICPGAVLAQAQQFNADSAYATIEYLTVTLGPRPMGSVSEREALAWTVNQFRRFGADSAYIMPFKRGKMMRSMVNTNSGVAIGIFRGSTDSTIVLGSHIDSANRDVPGANDNASGTASIIELARLWSQRQRHYTLVFTAFGGEEVGLVGSKHFVDHYPNIDQVALMIQLDMTGSDDRIITMFETRSYQAPAWLINDALDIDRALGNNRLMYPTQFTALNNVIPSAGSDHMPFLDKEIPAICFTTGETNSPIHTPQDRIQFISKPMLGLTGHFADSLVTRYQTTGIPGVKQPPYILWQFYGRSFFMPSWFAIPAIGLAIVLALLAFIYTRKHRLLAQKSERVRFTGLKLLFLLVIIAIFAQLGEAILQFLKGLRYPWTLPVREYLWFAGLWALAGAWVALQFSRFWRYSLDTYVYSKRVLVILLIFVIIATVASRHLALYPAVALICASLAFLIPIRVVKVVFALVALIPMVMLMFNEVLIFFARTSTHMGTVLDAFWKTALYTAFLTLAPVLWCLPVFYLLAYAVIKSNLADTLVKFFRKPVFGLMMLLPICAGGGYLFAVPAYNAMWRPAIQVNASYEMNTGDSKLALKGNEYFRDVRVQTDSIDSHYNDRMHQVELPVAFTADWFELPGTTKVDSGARDTLTIDWQILSHKPWYQATLKIKVDTLAIADVISELAYKHKKNQIQFTWYADPPESLQVTAQFTVSPGAKLIRTVTGIYPDLPLPIEVGSDLASIRYRTTVTCQDTLVLGN